MTKPPRKPATTTPHERARALVEAIERLEPGDMSAAFQLDKIEAGWRQDGETYVDSLIRRARKRKQGAVTATERIWNLVLSDIANRHSACNPPVQSVEPKGTWDGT
jgi:hypothetical protein